MLLDRVLGRDACVVVAGEEDGVEAAHAVPAHERVRKCELERVSGVERARDVWRRVRDHEPRPRRVGLGGVEAFLLPDPLPPFLDALRLVERVHQRAFRESEVRGRRGRLVRSRSDYAADITVARVPRERLPPETFDLPVEKIRSGYYSDAYFNFAREALLADDRHPRVLMQVFQKNEAILGGMDETIAVLKLCSWDWEALEVRALYDGDEIGPYEPVLTIEGDYTLFAHLETVYLGVLARRTLVSTNVKRVVDAAAPKDILFFPARHDHWLVQTGDGYAAHGGDTVTAARHFAEWAPPDMNVVVLVDFDNDSVRTSLEVARALGRKLWGVRLDTSERLVDRSLWGELGDFDPCGVNERLVRKVRAALDAEGSDWIRIVASGGFTVDKIRAFERAGVPVDVYGVGSSLLRGSNDFTADIVRVDGRPVAKVGRWERASSRLEVVT